MKNILLFFLLISAQIVKAQSNIVSTGSQASGSGGSAAYSVGQVAYTTQTGSNGTVLQGVQQPYEISVVTGIRNVAINLKAQVYPNPTADNLILSVDEKELKNLNYTLFDLQGKTIISGRLIHTNTTLNMSGLSNGTYLLKVFSKNKQIKTFKIVKNK